MLKILCDENVHINIILYLKNLKLDIATVVDAGLAGSKDSIILDYAEKQGRIILTGDKDFGGLLELGALYGRGKVILLRYSIMNISRINQELEFLLTKEQAAILSVKKFIIVLSEGRYRFHKIPDFNKAY